MDHSGQITLYHVNYVIVAKALRCGLKWEVTLSNGSVSSSAQGLEFTALLYQLSA